MVGSTKPNLPPDTQVEAEAARGSAVLEAARVGPARAAAAARAAVVADGRRQPRRLAQRSSGQEMRIIQRYAVNLTLYLTRSMARPAQGCVPPRSGAFFGEDSVRSRPSAPACTTHGPLFHLAGPYKPIAELIDPEA
jgi:hypothetical protein